MPRKFKELCNLRSAVQHIERTSSILKLYSKLLYWNLLHITRLANKLTHQLLVVSNNLSVYMTEIYHGLSIVLLTFIQNKLLMCQLENYNYHGDVQAFSYSRETGNHKRNNIAQQLCAQYTSHRS
jgi:hypothetical protein